MKTKAAFTLLTLSILLFPSVTKAQTKIPIEGSKTGAYSDWSPADGTGQAALAKEKLPDGRPAITFRFDMSTIKERAYWDLPVKLNLSSVGRISFWAKLIGEESSVSGATLYFNSGSGWYGAGISIPADTWSHITLDRAAFRPEDSPAGWQEIKTVRIAFWKGQSTAAEVLFGGLEGQSSSVAVVRCTRGANPTESATYAEQMAAALKRAGIDAGTVDDIDVEHGVLTGKLLAVYPHNPSVSDTEAANVSVFVKSGGRIIVCYALPQPLAALLGIQPTEYVKEEQAGQFASMHFTGAFQGLPAIAKQASWNIQSVKPTAFNSKIIGTWFDRDGKSTGYPAVVAGDRGAFITHVLLDDDAVAKDRLLRALAGHYSPQIWQDVATNALDSAGNVRGSEISFSQAISGVKAEIPASVSAMSRAIIIQKLAAAELALTEAKREFRTGRYAASIAMAEASRKVLLDAHVLAQISRPKEFRAVWCHNAYCIEGMNWDQAIKRLKESGFTAIMPNMLWGGVADYYSHILPVRDRVVKDGDQIAACAAACKRYGVQLHVWKVNWNLGDSPESFVSKMRSEHRLQKSSTGNEERWLCPSNSANFELERDAMLEIVKNYDVDGIHFDYIRYPDAAHCYCDGCRSRFESQTNKPVDHWPQDVLADGTRYTEYQEFRRDNITRLVRAVSEGAHSIKPGIKVSAAVFPDWPACREHIGQDWAGWIKAGYLDFVCPMDYIDSNSAYRSRIRVQRDAVAGRIPLIPGIGASAPGLPLGQVIDQINITREEHAGGFIIFNYDTKVACEYLPELGKGITKP